MTREPPSRRSSPRSLARAGGRRLAAAAGAPAPQRVASLNLAADEVLVEILPPGAARRGDRAGPTSRARRTSSGRVPAVGRRVPQGGPRAAGRPAARPRRRLRVHRRRLPAAARALRAALPPHAGPRAAGRHPRGHPRPGPRGRRAAEAAARWSRASTRRCASSARAWRARRGRASSTGPAGMTAGADTAIGALIEARGRRQRRPRARARRHRAPSAPSARSSPTPTSSWWARPATRRGAARASRCSRSCARCARAAIVVDAHASCWWRSATHAARRVLVSRRTRCIPTACPRRAAVSAGMSAAPRRAVLLALLALAARRAARSPSPLGSVPLPPGGGARARSLAAVGPGRAARRSARPRRDHPLVGAPAARAAGRPRGRRARGRGRGAAVASSATRWPTRGCSAWARAPRSGAVLAVHLGWATDVFLALPARRLRGRRWPPCSPSTLLAHAARPRRRCTACCSPASRSRRSRARAPRCCSWPPRSSA